MRLPARLTDHPLEALIAGALLLALLFGSAESSRDSQPVAANQPHATQSAKL